MFAKLSKKGQVTIPKSIRKKLNIEENGGVLFLVEDDQITLKGIPAARGNLLAGSLKKYAKKYVSLQKIRKDIKGEIADGAAKEGLFG